MTDRNINIETGAELSLRDRQLVILLPNGEEKTIPVEDIASLVLESQEASISIPALIALSENNTSVTLCDSRHQPAAMLLALHSNSVQTERFRKQIRLSDIKKDILWKQIVTEKIRRQANLLDALSIDGNPVRRFADDVLPGDISGREGAAAHEYWKSIFGKKFKRDRFGDGPNPLLNYGYAILRAAVVRSLVSCGLYPCLGLHHKNRYDDFPLADDVMEPYRPFVDLKVFELWNNGHTRTDREAKAALREVMVSECSVMGFTQSLMNALSITSSSLLDCINGDKEKLLYPE